MDVCTPELQQIIGVVKVVLTVLQWAVPIMLLIFGTVDLAKAVMAGDEKEIKNATSTLLKRAIAAVAVFLLFTVVSLITGLVGGDEWKDCWNDSEKGKIDLVM